MDEPTAALGVAQSAAVLELVHRVRERGTSVVIISHILPHVLELADRIVVVRHGRIVADLPAAGVSQDRLIALIVGAGIAAGAGWSRSPTDPFARHAAWSARASRSRPGPPWRCS